MLSRLTLIMLFCLAAIVHSQTTLDSYFDQAAKRYSVPKSILIGVGYAQTRLTHIVPDENENSGVHGPPVFGIMGLRNDNWFGHSLLEAARLIGEPVDKVISDERTNISGAAAFLSLLADEYKINRKNINSWEVVLEKYSGIPQNDLCPFFAFDVLSAIKQGIKSDEILLPPNDEIDLSKFPAVVRGEQPMGTLKSDDYPSAVWDPSPNYTSGSITQSFAVVHTTEGNFSGALSWLKNPAAQASSHYIIRSSDGYIVQLVRESNKAWHARCWNSYMLGVEHEAFVAQQSYYTDAMYIASAALFRHFAQLYSIPMNRNRIIGHSEWTNTTWKNWMAANYPAIDATCNTHTDPGVYWDWDFYMQLVSQDTTKPKVISQIPAANDTVWRNSAIKLTFNQKMKKTETQTAFSITPSATGVFTWADNQRTLVFTPSPALQTNTVYQVTLSTAAKNYLALSPQGAFTTSFRTKSALAVSSYYPTNNSTNVHVTPEIQITFNAPLNQASIAGNIQLQDSTLASVVISTIGYVSTGNSAVVFFAPLQPLKDNCRFTVTIKSGLQDSLNTAIGANQSFSFTTGKNTFLGGTVFDSLETVGGWKDPNYSGSTVGTDTSSSFVITGEKVKSGSYSGRIKYVFTNASGGVCRTFNATKPNQGAGASTRTGFWVYGDLSGNYLEYWFYYNTSVNTIVRVDTLNWTGWKYVEVSLAKINQSGDKLFHSVVIIQNANGAKSGAIYIDEGQKTDKSKITIACFIEGLFNPATNKMTPDTVVVSIRTMGAPATVLEQQTALLDSSGTCSPIFMQAVMGSDYYLVFQHRNSIETWTKTAQKMTIPILGYDFRLSKSSAYGDNLKLISGRYCIFSGDVNQDDIIDFTDLLLIENDAALYRTGYVATDLSGDSFVDYSDLLIADNNSHNFIVVHKP